MKRLVLQTIGAAVIATALLLFSCGPRAVPAPGPAPNPAPAAPTPVPATPAKPVTPTPAPVAAPDKPRYGGIFNIIQSADLEVFCPACVPRTVEPAGYVYEQFTNANWAKGSAGTGETGFGSGIMKWDDVTGWLAESFEIPEIGVWKLNIRKGVHFALDPKSEASRLANGRELTADDAVWSVQYLKDTPTSWVNLGQPGLVRNYSVEKTGPWQITVKTPVDPSVGYCWIMGGGGSQYLWAREVVEKYGKANDWRQTVGTGPFMLTDFVQGSVATFVRNPNYWTRNPAGPGKGDQLPYPDGLKILVVPDLSTRLAATRTYRVDWIDAITLEDGKSLLNTNPNLKYFKYQGATIGVAMRSDKKELPFKDVRVRQALTMAIDYDSLKKDLYGGEAEILTLPFGPAQGVEHIYLPLEKLPEQARNLFKYNPERAKQLLAEAGYPSGFKTKMIVENTSSATDVAAAFKAMWAKVGVDVELQPREGAVYRAINSARSQDELLLRNVVAMTGFGTRYNMGGYRSATANNPSYINDPPGSDPTMEAAFQEAAKNIFINFPKADQVMRDLIPYVVEQAFYIPNVAPYSYRIWQPWVKNYYGESAVKNWLPYIWIDQDLKQQLIGRR